MGHPPAIGPVPKPSDKRGDLLPAQRFVKRVAALDFFLLDESRRPVVTSMLAKPSCKIISTANIIFLSAFIIENIGTLKGFIHCTFGKTLDNNTCCILEDNPEVDTLLTSKNGLDIQPSTNFNQVQIPRWSG